MRSSADKKSLAILNALIICVPFSLAAGVMLEFRSMIGYSNSSYLLPSRTLEYMNWGTAAFFLVILLVVALPFRGYEHAGESAIRTLWSLRRRTVRAVLAIPLIVASVTVLRYVVVLQVATFQIDAPASRLQEIVEARAFFEDTLELLPHASDHFVIWSECNLRDIGRPCIVETMKGNHSLLHFRRENEADAITALQNAGFGFEKN